MENSVNTCADPCRIFTCIFINMFTNDSLFFFIFTIAQRFGFLLKSISKICKEKMKCARISSLRYEISVTAFRLHFHLVLKILMPQKKLYLEL